MERASLEMKESPTPFCYILLPPLVVLAIKTIFAVIVMIIGLFVALRPQKTIEIQQKFYAKINWRIEPISMSKEIRNTRLMGLFLVGLAIAVTILTLISK